MDQNRPPNSPLTPMQPPARPQFAKEKQARNVERIQGAHQAALKSRPDMADNLQPIDDINNPHQGFKAPFPEVDTSKIPPEDLERMEREAASDHAKIVGQEGWNEGNLQPSKQAAPPPPPPRAPMPDKPKVGSGIEHPVLQELRKDFGLENMETAKVKIGGHEFELRPLNVTMIAFATRAAQELSGNDMEHLMKLQCCIAAAATVAIDGIPSIDVMGVPVEAGDVIRDKRNLPERYARLCCAAIADFFLLQSKDQLGQKVYLAYRDKIDPKANVVSYLDNLDSDKVRYQCPEPECIEQYLETPRYTDTTKTTTLPVYCKVHGSQCVAVSSVEDDLNFPLE